MVRGHAGSKTIEASKARKTRKASNAILCARIQNMSKLEKNALLNKVNTEALPKILLQPCPTYYHELLHGLQKRINQVNKLELKCSKILHINGVVHYEIVVDDIVVCIPV